jgi:NAD-dependent oxidoreductase involved in siderophore biosynthesis
MKATFRSSEQRSELSSYLAARIASSWASLCGAVENVWPAMLAGRAGKYRPEAHYMRGPGPKWRAKHAQTSAGSFGQR